LSTYLIHTIDDRDEGLIGQLRMFRPDAIFQQATDHDHLNSIVVVSNGRIIGVVRLYRSGLHPTRWRLAIFVDPAFRRQSVGTTLFGACIHDPHLRADDEIQIGLSSADTGGCAFLQSVGFIPLMTTHLGSLSWHRIPDSTIRSTPATVTTLKSNPELSQAVAVVHEQVYQS
jgi:GNAT superfamily N-acetyltransferase